jgi:hypothetical protein
MTEHVPSPAAAPPRYSRRPFPPYRYLPFQGGNSLPHPRTDPAGHSYDSDEEYVAHFTPDDWFDCEPYLYGIDLFNHGYWWEAHDALEAVWLAAGQRSTQCGVFVQGLIQVAVAQLKRVIGATAGAQSLTAAGCEKLAVAQGIFLGIAVAPLIAEAQRCLREGGDAFPQITLHFPGQGQGARQQDGV